MQAAGLCPAFWIRLWGRGAWGILNCEPAVCQYVLVLYLLVLSEHEMGNVPLSQVRTQAEELSRVSKVTPSSPVPGSTGLEVTFPGAKCTLPAPLLPLID